LAPIYNIESHSFYGEAAKRGPRKWDEEVRRPNQKGTMMSGCNILTWSQAEKKEDKATLSLGTEKTEKRRKNGGRPKIQGKNGQKKETQRVPH